MPEVDRLMRRALAEGVFPGAVLRVARGERVLFEAAYGAANRFTGEPATPETVFDLASLTKPLATTLCLMRLCRQGRLDVERRLGSILPAAAGGEKAGITIAQLLAHTSGLPAYRPFYLEVAREPPDRRRAALRERLVREPLAAPPGERALYSDLGFMFLDWVVEAVSGRRLDRYAADEVFGPLGAASELFFVDLERPSPPRAVAATEQCPWRGRLVQAEVHDENAWAVGGVAGHAGLFGTAEGVHRILAELLAAYRGEEGAVADAATVRRFLARAPGADRALGFDLPADLDPSCGRFFPPTAVGHLGFTGTSFWVHLEEAVAVILLTNRVHPDRANIAIRRFRPRVHDAVMASLGLSGGAAAPG